MGRYVLAFAASPRPDLELPSLGALAQAIARLPQERAGAPQLRLRSCQAGRRPLPNGTCVSVRLMDGSMGGLGELVAYAFLPHPSHGGHRREQLEAAVQALSRPSASGGEAKAA